MIFLALFPILLIFLFFLSRNFTSNLSLSIFRLTRNQKWTITLFALFFLPGVIFHELSHLIIANLLFVNTGEVEFIPRITGNSLKLGSVAVAKTDPIRRFIIGAAPVICGIGLMIGLLILLQPFKAIGGRNIWQNLLFFYAIFQIGNTMFSSKKDMEGAAIFIILCLSVLGGITILNKNILFQFFQYISSTNAAIFWEKGDVLLAIIIAIDSLAILITKKLNK